MVYIMTSELGNLTEVEFLLTKGGLLEERSCSIQYTSFSTLFPINTEDQAILGCVPPHTYIVNH